MYQREERHREILELIEHFLETAEKQGEDGWRVPYIAFHRYRLIDDDLARQMLQRFVADHPEEIEKIEYFLGQEKWSLTATP